VPGRGLSQNLRVVRATIPDDLVVQAHKFCSNLGRSPDSIARVSCHSWCIPRLCHLLVQLLVPNPDRYHDNLHTGESSSQSEVDKGCACSDTLGPHSKMSCLSSPSSLAGLHTRHPSPSACRTSVPFENKLNVGLNNYPLVTSMLCRTSCWTCIVSKVPTHSTKPLCHNPNQHHARSTLVVSAFRAHIAESCNNLNEQDHVQLCALLEWALLRKLGRPPHSSHLRCHLRTVWHGYRNMSKSTLHWRHSACGGSACWRSGSAGLASSNTEWLGFFRNRSPCPRLGTSPRTVRCKRQCHYKQGWVRKRHGRQV